MGRPPRSKSKRSDKFVESGEGLIIEYPNGVTVTFHAPNDPDHVEDDEDEFQKGGLKGAPGAAGQG